MTNKRLHIVSFDVPFPADYGGAIDVFYRLKALHQLGVQITLHCFEYGRGQQKELEEITDKVHYYKRRKSIVDGISKKPFIVKSRDSEELLNNLLLDDAPILFEGLHSTYFLDHDHLKKRVKIVRTHNIEHDYYSELATNSSVVKKPYFKTEAKKLKSFESILSHASHILAIKQSEKDHFDQYCDNVQVLPASSPWPLERMFNKTEPYFLFHGNLSVSENELGASWLIKEVFAPTKLSNQLKIAGKNPSEKLKQLCLDHGVSLVVNPSDSEMRRLIDFARVHVFYTNQSTGVKLKLLNALATSGHVIVNDKMIEGTNLRENCNVASSALDFQTAIQQKMNTHLSQDEFESRIQFLEKNFNTLDNCRALLDLI